MARINGVSGVIEHVNLRTIVLRDGEGAVHVFPNGTVTALANLSKQFSNAIVDLRIGYAENLERVFDVIREVGRTMQDDREWGPVLLSPIEIVGVESLADGFALVRAKFKTQPLNQGAVANELRRRLMTMLTARGVTPYVTPSPAQASASVVRAVGDHE
jgi:small conductance mechanosensitive channel